jgi:D-arabinose 1-dehydrogenase-like Zn-dependent alcohol dehydrogenase
VGVIRQIGRDVTNVKVGQRVGFGYTHYVCGTCEQCLAGMLTRQIPRAPRMRLI